MEENKQPVFESIVDAMNDLIGENVDALSGNVEFSTIVKKYIISDTEVELKLVNESEGVIGMFFNNIRVTNLYSDGRRVD